MQPPVHLVARMQSKPTISLFVLRLWLQPRNPFNCPRLLLLLLRVRLWGNTPTKWVYRRPNSFMHQCSPKLAYLELPRVRSNRKFRSNIWSDPSVAVGPKGLNAAVGLYTGEAEVWNEGG